MRIFLMIVGVIFLFLIIFLFTYLQFEILLKRESKNDHGFIKIKAFFGLIRYTIRISKIDWEGLKEGTQFQTKTNSTTAGVKTGKEKQKIQINRSKIEKASDIYHDLLDHIHLFQATLRRFFSKVICEKCVWKTMVGTGDAAETGVLTGLVWGVKSFLMGLISSYIRWRNPPQLDVIPCFNQVTLETYFHGILRFRVWHAIVVLTRLMIQTRKGRERNWQPSTPFKA